MNAEVYHKCDIASTATRWAAIAWCAWDSRADSRMRNALWLPCFQEIGRRRCGSAAGTDRLLNGQILVIGFHLPFLFFFFQFLAKFAAWCRIGTGAANEVISCKGRRRREGAKQLLTGVGHHIATGCHYTLLNIEDVSKCIFKKKNTAWLLSVIVMRFWVYFVLVSLSNMKTTSFEL